MQLLYSYSKVAQICDGTLIVMLDSGVFLLFIFRDVIIKHGHCVTSPMMQNVQGFKKKKSELSVPVLTNIHLFLLKALSIQIFPK